MQAICNKIGACKNRCILVAFSAKSAANLNFFLPKVVQQHILKAWCEILNAVEANVLLFPAVKEF